MFIVQDGFKIIVLNYWLFPICFSYYPIILRVYRVSIAIVYTVSSI